MEYLDHAHKNHYQFRLGFVDGVDRDTQEILVAPTADKEGVEIIPRRSFHYDTLILAVGSLTNHFNIKGVEENCLFLDSLDEAMDFHQFLLKKMIKAQTRTAELREGELHVAIAGAGATGIELAAELHGATQQLIAFGFDQIEVEKDIKITIVEASPKILPALPDHLSNAALQELHNLDIDVMIGERVVEATDKGLKTESGKFIPAETMVWAAGIKAPDFLAEIEGLETNNINQLLVKTNLQTTNDENIFSFGDCASCPDGDDFVPPRAQAAHQQASLLVKSMKNRLAGKQLPTYKYVDYGSLVNLGNYSTVGSLMGNLMGKWSGSMRIEGMMARLVYKSLYKMHLISLHGYTHEILMTIASWLTNRGLKPRLKLH
ncbi:NADH dehydrogenase [Nymphon striatum]|nr:NADH dehydrogenase [Nymphon striatum]